ncbi:ABC transporter ATP-binding protein [Hyphobacterium sp. CCMP332]|nr:ABC transporter ATP-binding protein [Hyphobacterium sp. CCMP332]
MTEILEVKDLSKTYQTGGQSLTVLNSINFEIKKGDTMSIVGPSGSGKTTLLGLCAGLDTPSTGSVSLAGIKLNDLSEDDRAYVRNQHVGFVFQNFQLLPTLSALENVSIPLELRGEKNTEPRAIELLSRVGLEERLHHYPNQLSGGEQQRVAIARAFMANPDILFADEPTGNLDEETAAIITDLLFNLNKEIGTTLVMVTHNIGLANFTNRILQLKGGDLVSDKLKKA